MKTKLYLMHTARVGSVAALLVFAGCASAPLRQSTAAFESAPIPAVQNIGGQIYEQAVPMTKVQPQHPLLLKRAGITGVVNVVCTVDATGKVTDVAVESSTDKDFEEAALEAVKKWTFKAATQDGVAVSSRVMIPIEFGFID